MIFIYFLVVHLVTASPQINLDLTNWVDENNDLPHDCLHVDVTNKSENVHEIISYCMNEWPSKWQITSNRFDQILTFAELGEKNITSEQLYRWSGSMDVIENYQLYLDEVSIENVSSEMETQVFYNCTLPRFGSQCQYSLDVDAPHHLALNEIIRGYYLQAGEPKILTCYTHLQCKRGETIVCLDWSDICDGKVDCPDGVDEKNCFPLTNNECADDEYQCDNGQCIPKTFVNDGPNNFDCLDRSDQRQDRSERYGYIHSEPTFIKEDVICPWHETIGRPYMRAPPTSSCVYQHSLLIGPTMFTDTSEAANDSCLLAFKCCQRILENNDPLCSDFTADPTLCREIMNNSCPDIFRMPAGPIAYGHIYLVFTKPYIANWPRFYLMYPEYICFDKQLCGESLSNKTSLFINGTACGRLEDFSIHNPNTRPSSYLDCIWPLYQALAKCNTIIYDKSVVCNGSHVYQCKNSSKCIPKSYIGDRIADCDNNDDEQQTTIDELCLTDQSNLFFRCTTTNRCIPRNRVENGRCDCEENEYHMCDDENRQSNEIKRTITFSTVCDGFDDLLPMIIDGRNETDETNCDQWPCNNANTRCDGYWNCPDGADEINCDPTALIKCPSHHHICVSKETNELMCLPIEKANDGIIDCLGGTDEPRICLVAHLGYREKEFHCTRQSENSCLLSLFLCDGYVDCDNGEDEQFCGNTNGLNQNDPNNTDAQNFFYEYFYNSVKQKPRYSSSDKSESNMVISHSSEQQCHRGLPLRVWLDNENKLSTITCLCPPSYYGDHCQYQNQRVSLTIQFHAISYSRNTPFVLIISLIDDSIERMIHSYEQRTYLHMKDQLMKFNVHLLYSTRPKDLTKQYSVHIDIYESITLQYRGSFFIPLKFPFLPVERIATQFNIPHDYNSFETCADHQCGHGRCIQYLNDPKYTSFCQCERGWSGKYCNISHQCTCSSDSLCVGIAANNRPICVCPINKFGSRCLLNTFVCQSNSNDECLNGGQCLPIREHTTISNQSFVCICPKGYTGARCEIPDTKIILSFHKDMIPSSSSSLTLLHLIYFANKNASVSNKILKNICANDHPSIHVNVSDPFHTALLQLSLSEYYLIVNQQIYSQSAVFVRTIHPSDRCQSLHEIFDEGITRLHLLRRIKYYHLPCQNRSFNLSCFHDESYMCVCQDEGSQRFANCFKFDHQAKLDEFDIDSYTSERECGSDRPFNSSTPSTPISLTSTTSSPSATNDRMPSNHACGYFLYAFILLFCLCSTYIHSFIATQ